jgi:RNA polymerase sigma factor (sigma-70 family)
MTTATLDQIDLESHRPMVERMARGLLSRGHDLTLEDLTQAGFCGLIEAAERYDPDRGTLNAFMRPRVRGAMLDAIMDGGRTIRIPRKYHGPAAERLTGPSADAARDMRARRIVGDSQREDVLLADLVIDERPPFTLEEDTTMSRLNGYLEHPAPGIDPVANDKTCTACSRKFKNPKVKRCYYRDCPGFAGDRRAAKVTEGNERRMTSVLPTPSPVVRPPAPASSIALELRLMGEIASLPSDARSRLTAWVAALPR